MNITSLSSQRAFHPLDVVEDIALYHDWACERVSFDELVIVLSGEWANYKLSFSWMEEKEMLELGCSFPFCVAKERIDELCLLLAQVNSKLSLGHFDYWQQSKTIVHRQTLLLCGGVNPSSKQMEALLFNALAACEEYYQAWQMVSWSSASARQALNYTFFKTVGNA